MAAKVLMHRYNVYLTMLHNERKLNYHIIINPKKNYKKQ